MALAEQERRRRLRESEGLLAFIPRISPRWDAPVHLWPIIRFFERVRAGEVVKACVSVPPQHGKTETILHGLAWLNTYDPTKRDAYVSYGAEFAEDRSRAARGYARAAGVVLDDHQSAASKWATAAGGSLAATGINGPLTGKPIDRLLVIDDPHKNRQEAESAILRRNIRGWMTSTALPRCHPSTSVLVCHTRWHEDDTIGNLETEREQDLTTGQERPVWEVYNLPAVQNDVALWPKHRPLDWLLKHRRAIGEYDWWSLYMGQPRPRGTEVFNGLSLYEEPPTEYTVAIGADFAYSAKKRADFSVAVVMARVGRGPTARYYILHVERHQVPAPVFRRKLAALCARYSAVAYAYTGGTEKGVVDLMRDADEDDPEALHEGVPIVGTPAPADKFIRAQPLAAAWNAQRVLAPRGNDSWLPDFAREFRVFTGVGDRYDDQIDAAAAAFDALDTGLEVDPGPIPEVQTYESPIGGW